MFLFSSKSNGRYRIGDWFLVPDLKVKGVDDDVRTKQQRRKELNYLQEAVPGASADSHAYNREILVLLGSSSS